MFIKMMFLPVLTDTVSSLHLQIASGQATGKRQTMKQKQIMVTYAGAGTGKLGRIAGVHDYNARINVKQPLNIYLGHTV